MRPPALRRRSPCRDVPMVIRIKVAESEREVDDALWVRHEVFVVEEGKLGGKPVAEKSINDYAKALNAASLTSQADVLNLAARLEMGATNAYLGVIPAFKDHNLAQIAGRLAADETMHWTALTSALGRPLPTKALSFGA